MTALAEMAGAVENGDTAARSAAYAKFIRMCDELPENIASSPMVRGIRGVVAAQLTIGGHDTDHAESAIEDLERALDRPDQRWPEDGIQLIERLGNLLRLRGGPGDAQRSRELGLRALVQQTWRVLTRPNVDHGTSTARFARLVTGWCVEDGAHDDLVRVVEAERGVTLARDAGAELLHRHLVDTGRAALAEDWAAQQLDPAPHLSEEDKYALAEPMGPEEIRPLLRELGLDALVYLVPSHPTTGGMAVVVPVDSPVTSAQLPLLTEEWFTRNTTALDDIGGWAWLAGGAAVLAAGQAAGPRVALVPVGALAAVQWAAAWRETDTGRRRLADDVEITIVPAARFLVRTSPAGEEPGRSE
jgi:hypothetical protein